MSEPEDKEPEVTEEERKQQFVTSLLAALQKFENAPTKEQIENWKKHFEVFATGLDDSEIYLWRPISRGEYKSKKKELQDQSQAAQKPVEDGVFEEAIVQICLLWSSAPEALQKKAGSYEVLFEQIMLNSNFINAQMAAQMVIKL